MKLNKQNLVNKLGYVYLIRNKDNGLLKIGYSKDVERRMEEIQRAFRHVGQNPTLEIEYIFEGSIKLETFLHSSFKSCRVQNEWFNIENIEDVIRVAKNFEESNNEQSRKNNKTLVIDYLKENGFDENSIEKLYEVLLKYGYSYLLNKYVDDCSEEEILMINDYINYLNSNYLKQNIIDEFASEEPTTITLHFSSFCTKKFYKVELLIDLYIALNGEQPLDNVKFYMDNNFVEYVFGKQDVKPQDNTLHFKNGYFDCFEHFFEFFNSNERMEFLNDDTEPMPIRRRTY